MSADKPRMTDAMLWRCLDDADQRKSDPTLPLDARIRSFESYAMCLEEAGNRGYDYTGLRKAALAATKNEAAA